MVTLAALFPFVGEDRVFRAGVGRGGETMMQIHPIPFPTTHTDTHTIVSFLSLFPILLIYHQRKNTKNTKKAAFEPL